MAGSLSAGIVAVDLGTKWFAEGTVQDSAQPIAVTTFFNLVLHYNRGVSFGFLSTEHPLMPYALGAAALVLIVLVGIWLWRTSSSLLALGLTCIFGGAISNLLDRIWDGAVTDFLDFYLRAYHWPAFNLADVAITCGVVISFCWSFSSSKVGPDNRVEE